MKRPARSTLARLVAVAALTAGLVAVGHTPGLQPTPAKAARTFAAASNPQRIGGGDGFLCLNTLVSSASVVACSGLNSVGQLGDGTTTNRSYLAAISDGSKIRNPKAIAVGKSHACAIAGPSSSSPGEGVLYCWGDNQYGQLGDNTVASKSVPTQVADNGAFTNSGVINVIAGDNHTCAIKVISTVNTLFCWGLNDKGQLGDTTQANKSVPTAVQGVFASGGVYGTSQTNFGTTTYSHPHYAAGGEHTCAARASDNAVYCWGENGSGQLGNNSLVDSSTPVATGTFTGQAGNGYNSFVAAGSDFTCVSDSGSIKCWGESSSGQMGNGNTSSDVLIPTLVPNNGSFTNSDYGMVAAGGTTVCALRSTGSNPIVNKLWCWGGNNKGQVGDNTIVNKDRPTLVSDNSASSFTQGNLSGNQAVTSPQGFAVSRSTTDGFACVTNWCWGGNSSGQLAQNNTTDAALPVKVQVATITEDDVAGATVTAELTSAGVVVTFTGVPASGLNRIVITVAPTNHTLLPMQASGLTSTQYQQSIFSGASLPTVSGGSFSVTVASMKSIKYTNGTPGSLVTTNFETGGSYHLTYNALGSAGGSYADGWRIFNGTASSALSVTAGSTTTTTAAPTTTTTVAAPVSRATSGTTGSYANAVPGVTITDATVYTTAPTKVAGNSAISVLSEAQAATYDIKTFTPSVCLPSDDELVFIDEGRCIANIVNVKTRQVLRTLRTTVVDDDIADLRVGNEVAVLAPLYFHAGTANFKAGSLARIAKMKTRVSNAGSVLVAGHTGNLMGNTPENRKLSSERAQAAVSAMKSRGIEGPFAVAAVGALDPVNTGSSRADQDKNRRVVVVLIP